MNGNVHGDCRYGELGQGQHPLPNPADAGHRGDPPQAAGSTVAGPSKPQGRDPATGAAGSVPTGGGGEGRAGDFDPQAYRLRQDFTAMVGIRKETTRVPIQRPSAQSFFCPHPDPEWRIEVAVIEIKDDRENFLVVPSLLDELQGEWVPKVLVVCQTRQGANFLWPIRLPGPDGRLDSWNTSAMQIASTYGNRWIRLLANKDIGAYDVFSPREELSPPTWPDSPNALMTKAFRDHIIDTLEHPVVKRLRGLA